MADEDLCDALLSSKLSYRGNEIVALQYFRRGARLARTLQMSLDPGGLLTGKTMPVDIHDVKFTLEAFFVTNTALNHGLRV